MTITNSKLMCDEQPSLALIEVLNIAANAYPDEFLREYYDPKTGEYNHQGSGDTLAEFIVREIKETFDPSLPKAEQLREVCRVLKNALSDLESVVAAVEKA